MFKKKTSSEKIDETVSKSVNFELTIAEIAKRSERRAWWVTAGAITMSLILAGGYFYMLPLKEKVPFLVMADASTGMATVARLTDDITNQRITSSDALNRSNVAHFVLARESYDAALMNLRDWNTVLTMSSPGVAAGYTGLHSSQNPDSPYKTYGRERAIRVKILSIVLSGGGNGNTPKGATVRFLRTIYNKQNGGSTPLDSKIATLEFTYKTNLRMDEQYRIENPLGFQVTSYRVDSDFASPVPEEVPLAPHPAPTPPAALPSEAGSEAAQPGVVVPPSPIPDASGIAPAAAPAVAATPGAPPAAVPVAPAAAPAALAATPLQPAAAAAARPPLPTPAPNGARHR